MASIAACGRSPSAPTPGATALATFVPQQSPAATGAGQPAPLGPSVALIRGADGHTVAGSALIVDSGGYLLTTASALGRRATVLLPDGTSRRAVRLARDEASDLVLLKVLATQLDAIRIAGSPTTTGQPVFAVGFEQVHAALGQMRGTVQSGERADRLRLIETDIPFVPGFAGGALSDASGGVSGLVVSPPDGVDHLCAVPIGYALDWFTGWRTTVEQTRLQSRDWPSLMTAVGVSLRYPPNWAVTTRGDRQSANAEIVPNQRDAVSQLTLSIQPSTFSGDPISFAEAEFGDRSDAVIWETVERPGVRGVVLRLEQEGARVDLAYLFTGRHRIALNLTTALSMNDTGPSAVQATALFSAIVASLEVRAE